MLSGKQLQLGLHQRQRRAQFMGGVAGKLTLGGEGVVQTPQHLVKGFAELPEFRQDVLADLHVCQIRQLHLLHLRSKAAQGLQGVPADEIGQNPAEDRHRRRDVPVGHAEFFLGPVDHNGKILPYPRRFRIEEGRLAGNGVALDGFPDGVHIVNAGQAGQVLHGDAGGADEQNGHQGNAPLQGKPLHASSPPIRYPSPIRLRMGS